MNQSDRKLKNEALEEVYKIAKERDYKVYTFESSYSSTINQIFIENQKGQIGTVSDYYSGVSFGTIHKPTQGIGTGFGIGEEFENPENLDLIFNHSPHWATTQDREKVKKYSSWNEYISKETILKYYEL